MPPHLLLLRGGRPGLEGELPHVTQHPKVRPDAGASPPSSISRLGWLGVCFMGRVGGDELCA